LDAWASFTFTRAKTTILPHRGSQALVTHGPFAYSRNPIYVGNLMILVGVGLLAGSLWHVVLAPALAFAIGHFAIRREEAHLAARFPHEWAEYTARVRRWI
jgi:protein-S-isoprenylcysteine O-methyltransferase Ste14